MNFSWLIGPIGPILSAIITFFATYFFLRERRRVTFLLSNSEDLTLLLRRQSQDVVTFKITGEDWFNLNRAAVVVKNTGNTSIKDLRFDIEIPRSHNHYRAGIANASPDVARNIKITWDEPAVFINPSFHVELEFLNRHEFFELYLFFEGTTDNCKVRCRMEGIDVRVKEATPTRGLLRTLRGHAT
jgi:hypothetical protein